MKKKIVAETSSSAVRFFKSANASPERTTASAKAFSSTARVFSTATYSESDALMLDDDLLAPRLVLHDAE